MVKELFICSTSQVVNIGLDYSISRDTNGDIVPVTFSAVLDAQGNNVSGQPSWLVVLNDGAHGDIAYQLGDDDVEPPAVYPNDQKYTIVVGTALGNYYIVVNPSCPPTFNNSCCGVELIWINREGGINSAYFIDRKTISTDIGEGDIYKDIRSVNSYSRRDASTRQRTVSTGKVDKRMGKLIESLSTAIQAWERMPDAAPNTYIDLPILVKNTAVFSKEPKQQIWEWLINYDYAKDLTTQNG